MARKSVENKIFQIKQCIYKLSQKKVIDSQVEQKSSEKYNKSMEKSIKQV